MRLKRLASFRFATTGHCSGLRSLTASLSNRRGAISLVFAVSATALFGMAALATEAGNWYLVREQAQNAADAAALAGARAAAAASAAGDTTAAIEAAAAAAAIDTAERNGYTDGGSSAGYTYTVTADTPSSGSYADNPLASEVLIDVSVTPYLASLFVSGDVTISTRSVAYAAATGTPACVLALGQMTISANQSSGSTSACYLASNSTLGGSTNWAIAISGSPTVSVAGMSAEGDCNGCSTLTVGGSGLVQAFKAYQDATTNPFAAVDTLVSNGTLATAVSSYTCISSAGTYLVPGKGIPFNATYPTGGAKLYAYCNSTGATLNLTISTANTLVIPATYYFVNTNLTLSGSGSLACASKPTAAPGTPAKLSTCTLGSGASMLLLSSTSSVGALTIASTFTFGTSFGALKTSDINASLDGILFYSTTSGAVSISGAASKTYLNGALYFPNATVTYSNAATTTCTVLVGKTLTLGATADFAPATSFCTSLFGVTLPQLQTNSLGE